MSVLRYLDNLTSSLFSSYENIECLKKLLEWGKEYLLSDEFADIINGRFEKIMKPGDTISIKMQPIYLCIIKNKLKSLQLLQEYGVQMVLNDLKNLSILDVAIESDIDNIFLQYLLGDKRDYSHSLLEFPIRRSEVGKIIFLLDYVQITTTKLEEYFKIYDREDSRCKYHLDNVTKDNHKKMIRDAYIAKRVKELCYIIRYDKDSVFKNIFKILPLEIFARIVSFL
jgi:hypothetical protein